jgi:catechol-2,3-dioxygenase
MPFDFKKQHDFDLHLALEVAPRELETMMNRGKSQGIETRGISDHGVVHSIYFCDPNGYVIELAAKTPAHDKVMDPSTNGAREKLDTWQAAKRQSVGRQV